MSGYNYIKVNYLGTGTYCSKTAMKRVKFKEIGNTHEDTSCL